MKYLLSWSAFPSKYGKRRRSMSYRRYAFGSDTDCFADVSYSSGWGCCVVPDIYQWPFETAELAMEACDKLLLSKGYVLLTEERAEKLRLLL